MKLKTLILFSFFASSQAFAYSIDRLTYHRAEQVLEVSISFEGGEKNHEFSALFDPCVRDTNPMQLAVRLVDTGWDDTGDQSLKQVARIDLKEAQCSPAEVTVFLSNRHATIFVD